MKYTRFDTDVDGVETGKEAAGEEVMAASVGPLSREEKMTKVRKPSEFLRGNPVSIHISTQGLRNKHTAIGLLIVLKNGQPGAPDG